MDGQVENILPPSASLGSLSLVLCLFRQVQASNDASLLYHKLFSLYVHIPHCCSSSSLSSYHCLPRVLVPSILPSKTVRDSLLNTWPNQFYCLVWRRYKNWILQSTANAIKCYSHVNKSDLLNLLVTCACTCCQENFLLDNKAYDIHVFFYFFHWLSDWFLYS